MDEVLRQFKERVLPVISDPQVRFILFGSRGRNTHLDASDYDLLIISDKKCPTMEKTIEEVEIDIFVQTSRIINSHLFTTDELEKLKYEPFILNALKEGVAA